MERAKRYLIISLSFAVALTVFATFTPKIAHAITATLVQVVNTAGNPIPTQPVHARQALRLTCDVLFAAGSSGTNCPFIDPSTEQTYVIPAAKRMVIDSESGTCTLPAGVALLNPGVQVDAMSSQHLHTFVGFTQHLEGTDANGLSYYHLAGDGTAYVDAGGDPVFFATRSQNTGQVNCSLNLEAHLEDVQ